MADITNVGSATTGVAGNAVKSITLNVPSGVANGDELIAALTIQNTTPAMTAPGGWTLVTSISNATANGQIRVYRRIASSEPASYTWTTNSNGRLQGVMRAYRNSDTTVTPFGSGQANSSSTVVTAPGQTTTLDRSMLVWVGAEFTVDALTSSSYSSPLVEVVDQHLDFAQWQAYAEGLKTDGAGASGDKSGTLNSAAANIAVLVVLTPVVSATTAYKDAGDRFRLRVDAWSHLTDRFRLQVQNYSHRAARFALSVGATAWSDRAVRFRLVGENWRDVVARFCASIFRAGRRFDLIPTRANRQPAFGAYLRAPTGIRHGTGLYVLTLTGDRISAMTRFDNSVLPSFGLPRSLPNL